MSFTFGTLIARNVTINSLWMQRMDSPASCASCTMPTTDKSNHSAAGTLHPHHTDTRRRHIPR